MSLVLKDGFKTAWLKNAVPRVKRIIKYFRKSNVARALLATAQVRLGQPQRTLVYFGETRIGSTVYMVCAPRLPPPPPPLARVRHAPPPAPVRSLSRLRRTTTPSWSCFVVDRSTISPRS